MGGKAEQPFETFQPFEKSLDLKRGQGRIHEAQGEIHFHDDQNGLKVAVPVHVAEPRFKAWILSPNEPLIFLDVDRQTMVVISPCQSDIYGESSDGISDLDVSVCFQKVRVGSNLRSLIDHFNAR